MNSSAILIVKPSSLGDVIHTLPLVHCLKRCFPERRIGWIVQQGYASLLEQDPAVDVVYPIRIPSTSEPGGPVLAWWHALRATVHTLLALRRQLRKEPYSQVLDLHASFRSGLLGLCNPGGRRIGFADAREGNTWFQHQTIPVGSVAHALEKNLLFCKALGAEVRQDDFFMVSQPAERSRINQFLAESGAGGGPLLYLAPAARWQTKFWGQEKWTTLAGVLREAGLQPIVGGSKDEVGQAEAICTQAGPGIINAAGRFSLPETVALMQRCALYVGLDTGPMHMAALLGLPVVALFGPTHPERVGPYGVEHRIVQAAGADCLGCRKRSCPSMACMRGISVGQVFLAIKECLP